MKNFICNCLTDIYLRLWVTTGVFQIPTTVAVKKIADHSKSPMMSRIFWKRRRDGRGWRMRLPIWWWDNVG